MKLVIGAEYEAKRAVFATPDNHIRITGIPPGVISFGERLVFTGYQGDDAIFQGKDFVGLAIIPVDKIDFLVPHVPFRAFRNQSEVTCGKELGHMFLTGDKVADPPAEGQPCMCGQTFYHEDANGSMDVMITCARCNNYHSIYHPCPDMLNVADLVDAETGKTYRQANAETPHHIQVGSLVEIKNTGARLFVIAQARDCDMTPLYDLWILPADDRPHPAGFAPSGWQLGYTENSLTVISQPATQNDAVIQLHTPSASCVQCAGEIKFQKSRVESLISLLQLILDQVDYTAGACRPNEPVGGVLPREVIEKAKNVLELAKLDPARLSVSKNDAPTAERPQSV